MDPHFRNFFRVNLDLERGYETCGDLRPTLLSFSDSYVTLIRTGFEEIIADDSFGPDEYERLTGIEFPDQETLKTYLREMYDYLFNDGPEQPMPPEQTSMKATMSFAIQAGRPALRECRRAADMRDAVGEMYALGVEDAILVWNRVPVRLSYGYDVAILLDDLVPLLEEVRRPEFSDAEVFWGSDTFSAEWEIVREDDSLRIRARWHSVLGNYESLLTERGDAVVHTEVFVSEWSKVLRRIVTDIDAEFVELNDGDIFLRVKSLIGA
ncbi:hypothetical protein ACFCX3_11160 [Streptomyces virginiae]|uniref:hypothetical protein n=1 Tax=Streptomyces virginiae TaxID=1961 RepID=UPI0035DC44FB